MKTPKVARAETPSKTIPDKHFASTGSIRNILVMQRFCCARELSFETTEDLDCFLTLLCTLLPFLNHDPSGRECEPVEAQSQVVVSKVCASVDGIPYPPNSRLEDDCAAALTKVQSTEAV
jgi:hypothetical protein